MSNLVSKDLVVNAPVDKVYDIWAHFENFPHFMHNIKQVHSTAGDRSHWVLEGPMGVELEWNAETTKMDPNNLIAWHSVEGDIDTEGRVEFESVGGDQTRVKLSMSYDVPAGKLGNKAATMFDNPSERVEQDLENFRRYVETNAA